MLHGTNNRSSGRVIFLQHCGAGVFPTATRRCAIDLALQTQIGLSLHHWVLALFVLSPLLCLCIFSFVPSPVLRVYVYRLPHDAGAMSHDANTHDVLCAQEVDGWYQCLDRDSLAQIAVRTVLDLYMYEYNLLCGFHFTLAQSVLHVAPDVGSVPCQQCLGRWVL